MNNHDYDNRVKNIFALENALKITVAMIIGIVAFGLVALFVFPFVANAKSTQDLFMVPFVRSTGQGAQIYQPQNGMGLNNFNSNNVVGHGKNPIPGNFDRASINLSGGSGPIKNPGFVHQIAVPILPSPNFADNISYYRPPAYDPYTQKVTNPIPENNFSHRNNLYAESVSQITSNDLQIAVKSENGVFSDSGTVESLFVFNAVISQNALAHSRYIETRWDFDGDSIFDTKFSTLGTVVHAYKKPGIYNVTLQAIDFHGNVVEKNRILTIVENEAPITVFSSDKSVAPEGDIITFNTNLTQHNQYPSSSLKYRFDWNGDGIFDTAFYNKTVWRHVFDKPGNYRIVAQSIDPQGYRSEAELFVKIVSNSPPVPSLKYTVLPSGTVLFDASDSFDDFSSKLRYRFDFNHHGKNDIIFDTSWTSSPKNGHLYSSGGEKTVRMQIMDEQGAVSELFLTIVAPWLNGQKIISSVFGR